MYGRVSSSSLLGEVVGSVGGGVDGGAIGCGGVDGCVMGSIGPDEDDDDDGCGCGVVGWSSNLTCFVGGGVIIVETSLRTMPRSGGGDGNCGGIGDGGSGGCALCGIVDSGGVL